MGAALPVGDPAPRDGALPTDIVASPDTDFGVYLHVPFCRVRCGYCDFNTYVLGSSDALATYQEALERELELATARLEAQGLLPDDGVSTIFVGGGTPSILGGEGLAQILAAVRHTMKIAPGAEVTTEANPLMVMLLMAMQSTHILQVPSFLGTSKTSTAQGDTLSLTYPFSSNSCT